MNRDKLTGDVLYDVLQERKRQNRKYGYQRHSHGKWLAIKGEEDGEVCEAVNRIHFPLDSKPTDADNLYEELIHSAAVSLAWAEQIKEES